MSDVPDTSAGQIACQAWNQANALTIDVQEMKQEIEKLLERVKRLEEERAKPRLFGK